jgi:Tol biopolymer transport system component/serine/threonine protein kinase
MTPEHWQHIKEIFYGALERPPAERDSFIDSACAGDEETRYEVSQLVSAHEQTGEFLIIPALDLAAKSLANNKREEFAPGQIVSHYTIIKAIGAGGMGEVYLAEDARLGRKVAIKLLRASVTTDIDRLNRFEREARAASALNHPNLCTIHEVGEMEDGRPYIVMEYIQGVSLRERLGQGQLQITEVLDIAMQVGSALAAAHQAGIVHRDIKPENITLRPDGILKVLDFGLAKLTEQRQNADPNMSTQLRPQTETGMVMGTARYMSPEQARGYPVDTRTDIWSMGVVMYEMTSGRVPFDGATNTDVVVSVLEREPVALMDHRPQAPAELDRIITKALRKNREERYRSVEDLYLDLKSVARELELKGTSPSDTEQFERAPTIKLNQVFSNRRNGPYDTPPASSFGANFTEQLTGAIKSHKILVALALFGVAVIVTLGFLFWPAIRKTRQDIPGTISIPVGSMRVIPFTSFPGREDQADFSPDGNQIAFVWAGEKNDNPDIYVKSISGERPLRITSDPAIDILPAWSPDGQKIAFVRIAEGRFAVYTVPSLGNGAERRLLTLARHPGKISWSLDGKFIAVSDKDPGQQPSALFLFSTDTGEKHRLTSPPANISGDFCPTFSPDGQNLAFVRATSEITGDVYVMRAAGGEVKRLTTDSRLRFYDQGVIGGLAWTGDSQTVVYTSEAGGAPSLWKVSIFGGTPERLPVGGVDTFYPSTARNGNRLAFTQIHGGRPVYQIEVASSAASTTSPVKLIASTRSNYTPQFSPDGRKIAFESDRTGTHEIWICDSDGTNPIQLTNFGGPNAGSPRWSPDGKQIVFDVHTSNIGHIYVVSIEGGIAQRVTTDTLDEGLPTWSRDGEWIYFCSNRSGDQQLWKLSVPGGQPMQVTKHGGFTSFESADGKFLYYSKGPLGVWRTPVDGGEESLILDTPNAGGWGGWAAVDDGIYFINTQVKAEYGIDFFSFATRRTKRITIMENVNEFVSGLAISSDRQRILYTQQETLAADIMLVENFR